MFHLHTLKVHPLQYLYASDQALQLLTTVYAVKDKTARTAGQEVCLRYKKSASSFDKAHIMKKFVPEEEYNTNKTQGKMTEKVWLFKYRQFDHECTKQSS